MTGRWFAGETRWPTGRVDRGVRLHLRSSSTGLAREFEAVAGQDSHYLAHFGRRAALRFQCAIEPVIYWLP